MQHSIDGSGDYNVMIKRPIDEYCFKFALGNVDDVNTWDTIKEWRKL